MDITKDDIRAAVASGLLTEAQAADLTSLAQTRQGYRENLTGLDEPFELFRGFNEIFIVIGLSILFFGWMAMTFGLSFSGPTEISGAVLVMLGVLTCSGLALLGRYFILTRRMVAPAIALVAMTAVALWQIGTGIAYLVGQEDAGYSAITFGTITLGLAAHYWYFRVPITTAAIALAGFGTLASVFVAGGVAAPDLDEFFRLSANGPFAITTVLCGLIALTIALRFDTSDPHRMTRRAASGFWLHVIAAPAIVNTLAVSLIEVDSTLSLLVLALFLVIISIFAVAIDRRSFLISGIGYVIFLIGVIAEDAMGLFALLLGVFLVFLGAKWQEIRGRVMGMLPEFPGKTRLPPWTHPDKSKDTE